MGKMITRAVDGTKATVKVVSKTTDKVSTLPVVLSKDYTEDTNKAFKEVVKALAENDDLVVIKIESLEKVHKLFGLDVAKFMELAVELDPTTRKVLEVEATEEVTFNSK